MVQTHCNVLADMLTHCYQILSKLSSSFLHAAGLKTVINSQGGNCIPSSPICMLFRFLYFFFIFALLSYVNCSDNSILNNKIRLLS